MTDREEVRDATRGFRRRVATGHTQARRQYLTPELREEAEALRAMIDKLYATVVEPNIARRVTRIRQGATIKQSRSRRWRPQTGAHGDDDR